MLEPRFLGSGVIASQREFLGGLDGLFFAAGCSNFELALAFLII